MELSGDARIRGRRRAVAELFRRKQAQHKEHGVSQAEHQRETITWTQSLSTDGKTLSFEVSDGQSNTWGVFGKDMRLDDSADLSDLGGYSSEFSTKQSGVTYGSNRVDKLVIKEVRRYGASGLLSVDSTPKVVFELNASN